MTPISTHINLHTSRSFVKYSSLGLREPDSFGKTGFVIPEKLGLKIVNKDRILFFISSVFSDEEHYANFANHTVVGRFHKTHIGMRSKYFRETKFLKILILKIFFD